MAECKERLTNNCSFFIINCTACGCAERSLKTEQLCFGVSNLLLQMLF